MKVPFETLLFLGLNSLSRQLEDGSVLWRREIQHLFPAQQDINVKQDQTWEEVLWFLPEHEASALLGWARATSYAHLSQAKPKDHFISRGFCSIFFFGLPFPGSTATAAGGGLGSS